jgi:hypothetical protein
VISIAHLEPYTEDPFERPSPSHPDAVYADEWEIEKILAKRVKTVRGKHFTDYLVRWTGYGPEFDEWRRQDTLENAKEAIDDFEKSQKQEHLLGESHQNTQSPQNTQERAQKLVPKKRGRPRLKGLFARK